MRRYLLLLTVLTAYFLVSPLVVGIGPPGVALTGLFVLVLLATVFAVSEERRTAVLAALLAAAALVLRLAHLLTGETWLAAGALATGALFLAATCIVVLRHIMRPAATSVTTTGRITGAVCVYLLLGAAWAFVYTLVELWSPGAFSVPPAGHGEIVFTYFSFSTLTTLGYGDVTPLSVTARTLSWMEAVTGQIFLAVIVATLVGLRLSRSTVERQTVAGEPERRPAS